MPLSADVLLDRLTLKRSLTRWRLIAILAVVLALFALAGKGGFGAHEGISRPHIARITIEGVIDDDRDRDKLITSLRNNNSVKAVIVWLNTPGGSAVGGEELFLRLRELAQKKPVVAVMRDVSASAGYLTALGADRIFAREGTLTGSIGVIIEAAEFSGLEKKIGVTPMIVKTGPLKDAFSPFVKESPEAAQVMQGVVDSFFQYFVKTVAERRHLPVNEVLKLADGRIYTGSQALNLKLIDALGGEEDAVAWLESARKVPHGLEILDAKVKRDKLPDWLDHLLGSAIHKILPSASDGLDGLAAIWHPSLQIQ